MTSLKVVLNTCWFNDKIFGYHFLVLEGCVIMNQKVVNEKKKFEPTGDKYFRQIASNHNRLKPFKCDIFNERCSPMGQMKIV